MPRKIVSRSKTCSFRCKYLIQVSVSNVACYFPEVIEYLFVYLAAVLIPNHVYSSANEITKVIKKFVIHVLNVKSYNVSFIQFTCLAMSWNNIYRFN